MVLKPNRTRNPKGSRDRTARSTEPTKAIVVNSAHFAGFLDIAPHFCDMFATSASAYQKFNVLRREKEEMAGEGPAEDAAAVVSTIFLLL